MQYDDVDMEREDTARYRHDAAPLKPRDSASRSETLSKPQRDKARERARVERESGNQNQSKC